MLRAMMQFVFIPILYSMLNSCVESIGSLDARSGTNGCKTSKDGPKVNVTCVFPFTYKGIKRTKCIFETGDETPWCSTKVDENGKHVSGQDEWGYCKETCPIDGLNDCRTTGKGGGKTNTECIFPFIYKDKRYQKCVWSEGESEPWCSTKVTKHGFHVGDQGEWGYCNSNCPISPRPVEDVITKEPEKEQSEINEEYVSVDTLDEVFQDTDEYYGDYYEDYEMYDEDHLPDLTKPVDRIAASSNVDYSSGSSGVSDLKVDGKRRCKRKCLQYKRVRKNGILGNLIWKCVKKGCQGPSRDR